MKSTITEFQLRSSGVSSRRKSRTHETLSTTIENSPSNRSNTTGPSRVAWNRLLGDRNGHHVFSLRTHPIGTYRQPRLRLSPNANGCTSLRGWQTCLRRLCQRWPPLQVALRIVPQCPGARRAAFQPDRSRLCPHATPCLPDWQRVPSTDSLPAPLARSGTANT